MPTPIRTQVIEAIKTALETITELNQVDRFQPRPVDLSKIKTPACFIYDSAAEQLSRANRYAQSNLELALAVFIALTNQDESTGGVGFNDTADIIQAEIHNAILTQIPNSGMIVKIEEQSVEREISNPNWGVMIYTILVTYRHTFTDGYSVCI